MNIPNAPNSARANRTGAGRLEIARKLYRALAVQDPDRVIILHEGGGRVVARDDLRPEQDDPEIAS
jgi:hypothetical protein